MAGSRGLEIQHLVAEITGLENACILLINYINLRKFALL